MNIYQLTRQGKNPCPKCKNPMEVYYGIWCPRCDKPEAKLEPKLNLIQCLRYLEANGHEGIRDRVWNYVRDSLKNDTGFYMFFPSDEERQEYSEQELSDLDLIKSTWDIKDNSVLMWVSW
jgi:hypothetical protein